MMFLFKKWIVNDLTAQNFLREHNGLNFMLNRLFQEERQMDVPGDRDEGEDVRVEADELSSDESDPQKLEEEAMAVAAASLQVATPDSAVDGKQPAQPLLQKQVGVKTEQQQIDEVFKPEFWSQPPNSMQPQAMPNGKQQDAANAKKQPSVDVADITQKLKEKDFGSTMRIIHTSDRLNMAESLYKNLNLCGYKSGMSNTKLLQVGFTQNPHLQPEYSMVMAVNGVSRVQISELSIGVFSKFSIYEKDMSYLPLIVMAEGGMKHKDGQLEELQWAVPLTPRFDQGMLINDVQCYAHDFDCGQLRQGEKDGDQIEDSSPTKIPNSFTVNYAKFIKITLRYPMTALLEASSFYGQLHKPMNYTFQFISCIGSSSVAPEQILEVLTDIQKESSLQMLSQFFQGKFSETFKSMSSEPEIILKIKEAFKRIQILLETKQELIKPIFISLCQDNDELCNWVISEQILNADFDKVSQAQIIFLGELINAQQQPESFIQKVIVIRDYLFGQVQAVQAGLMEVGQPHKQDILIKLSSILVKSMKNFKSKFPSADPTKEYEIKFSEEDLMAVLTYKQKQSTQFKSDKTMCKRILRAIEKLLVCMLQSPRPFKNSSQLDIEKAAAFILGKQIEALTAENKEQTESALKSKLSELSCLDILTTFASHSQGVYKQMQKVKVGDKDMDLIQMIID